MMVTGNIYIETVTNFKTECLKNHDRAILIILNNNKLVILTYELYISKLLMTNFHRQL